VRVLVVDDDVKVADLIRRALARDGHAVDVVHTGADAVWMATEVDYGAIVLDVGIPPPDGFEVCRVLRRRDRWAPILLLTARRAIGERVTGLDAGADDYLPKPFAMAELSARLRAITRRAGRERPAVLAVADISLDPASREVMCGGQHVELSPKEFALLELFLRHPGDVLTRRTILDHVWDFAYDGGSNVVDVYVRYLRTKLAVNGRPSPIETVRGVGYRLRDDPTGGSRSVGVGRAG
jgi:two-component system OmpR family response regulator